MTDAPVAATGASAADPPVATTGASAAAPPVATTGASAAAPPVAATGASAAVSAVAAGDARWGARRLIHITTTLYPNQHPKARLGQIQNRHGEWVDSEGRIMRTRGTSGSQIKRRLGQTYRGGEYEEWGDGQVVWRNKRTKEIEYWKFPDGTWKQSPPLWYMNWPSHRRGLNSRRSDFSV